MIIAAALSAPFPQEAPAADHNQHLFHGAHLWGLGDFHSDGEAEESRSKRSPQEDAAADEASEGGDHNDHLFFGQHLWGLEDFHIDGGAAADEAVGEAEVPARRRARQRSFARRRKPRVKARRARSRSRTGARS